MPEAELIAPNVSSVPQYSPFRYPGGKSWLHPFVVRWLRSRPTKPEALIEPFAGGGHVGLAAAIEELADSVLLVELDEDVASVWKTVLSPDCRWLARRIVSFEMDAGATQGVLEARDGSLRERAFRTILRNRISRGGVTAPGSGKLDRGERGRGLNSRWYPRTLEQRVLAIFAARSRLSFVEGDGLAVMRRHRARSDAVFFVDPPYPGSGRRLYRYSDVAPQDVFCMACSLAGDFVITYDSTDEIHRLVDEHGLQAERIRVSTSHHQQKYELIIARELAWLRNPVRAV